MGHRTIAVVAAGLPCRAEEPRSKHACFSASGAACVRDFMIGFAHTAMSGWSLPNQSGTVIGVVLVTTREAPLSATSRPSTPSCATPQACEGYWPVPPARTLEHKPRMLSRKCPRWRCLLAAGRQRPAFRGRLSGRSASPHGIIRPFGDASAVNHRPTSRTVARSPASDLFSLRPRPSTMEPGRLGQLGIRCHNADCVSVVVTPVLTRS